MIWIATGSPSELHEAPQTDGPLVFSAVGGTAPISYNAIGFHESDGFLYGMENHTNTLIRIGQDGAITTVGEATGLVRPTGTTWNAGTIGDGAFADTLFVRSTAQPNHMWGIDVNTLAVTEIALSTSVANTSDIVWSEGYVWGFLSRTEATSSVYRIDPATGTVAEFSLDALGILGPFGAQWTFENGNFGLMANTTGNIYEVAVSDPASAAPTFTLVSTRSGPPTSDNDGASSNVHSVDLALTKAAPAAYRPGEAIDYEFTVTNNGPLDASDWRVTDAIPAGLSDPVLRVGDVECDFGGGTLDCAGAGLPVGDSVSFTVEFTTGASTDACVVNSATVSTTDHDVDETNDTASATACPAQITLKKSGSADPLIAGDRISYFFDVTNTGLAPVTSVVLHEQSFSGTGPLSEITCPAEQAALAPGASVRCSAKYTVEQDDVDAGIINNSAYATAEAGDLALTSNTATASVPGVPDPLLLLTKEANDSHLGDPVNAGDELEYTFTVTNGGNTTLRDVTVVDGLPGVGNVTWEWPGEVGRLSPGESASGRAKLALTTAQIDAGGVTNTASASGATILGVPVASDEVSVTTSLTRSPAITLEKSADASAVSDPPVPGQQIDYSFRVKNTGNVTLHDVRIDDQLAGLSAIDWDWPGEPGELAPGASASASASRPITADDIESGEVTNSASASALDPGGTEISSRSASVTSPIPPVPGDNDTGETGSNGAAGDASGAAGSAAEEQLLSETGTDLDSLLAATVTAFVFLLGGALLVAARRPSGSARRG